MLGLASKDISMFEDMCQLAAMVEISRSIFCGETKDGVPPPKNMEVTSLFLVSSL